MTTVGSWGTGEADTTVERAADAELATPFALTYQPALDGVRAIAVVLVVVFHLDIGLLSGGYLGVSVFFTLSGFLITTLLLREASGPPGANGGRIDLGRFYLRRIKRLLPASIATLFAVILLAAVGVLATTATLRGDITAAAWNVFNWRELASGDSYADLFVDESPIAHFWSLAIEEQFYLLWPLVIVGLTRVLGLRRRVLLVTLSALFLLSSASAIAASPDVTYLATHTRAAEILAGAILATWMATATSTTWPRWWGRLAGPAIAVIVAASIFTPSSSGWAFSGGLAVFAWVSVALIAGLQTGGRTRALLSFAPLVALGRISYGVYLVHWPVFVVLDERRLGEDGWSLAAVRLLVTAAIAIVMYLVLERPIRATSRSVRPLAAAALAVATMCGVTLAAIALVPSPPPTAPAPAVLGSTEPSPQFAPVPENDRTAVVPVAAPPNEVTSRSVSRSAPRDAAMSGVSVREPGPDATTGAASTRAAADRGVLPALPVPPAVEPPVTVAVFGDSVPAWLLRDAAASFARSDAVLLNGALEACDGMVDLPLGRDRRANELAIPDDCFDWQTTYPATLANAPNTDVALLVLGQAPVVDRLIDGRWQGPCESIAWYVDDLATRIDYLRMAGAHPVLAVPARFGERVKFILTDDHLDRISCVRSALLAAADQLEIDSIDLDELLCPNGDCEAMRTGDGVHIDPDRAPEILNTLVDRVLATWRSVEPSG